MKKIIKKFWGVAFVVVLLSTLFVGAVPQVAAGNFALSDTFATPGNAFDTSTKMAPAAGFGIFDVAQSGATVYAVGNATATTDYLYKSTDGGLTYVQTARGAAGFNRGLPYDGLTDTFVTWGLVAVAPDDPNIVVVVNTENVTSDTVWLSTTGGAVFTNLPNAAAANITCVAISSALGPFRYISIGGQTGPSIPTGAGGMLQQWTMGATAPAWATITRFANLATDGVWGLAYSPNFGADQSLLVVTETVGSNGTLAPSTNGFIGLHVYRYDLADWDQNVDASFPRYLARTWDNGLTCTRASIALDPNFYMGDEAAQIGFIGATVTANVAGTNTVLGGVYRIGTYAPATVLTANNTLTLIDPGVGINSVAWDGTNLMAAVIGVPAAGSGLVVRRSATALSPFPAFLPSTTVKTPGTGNATLVLFNSTSAVGLAFSRGNNSAVARTNDYGKSFNGIALVNSLLANLGMGTFYDMWSSPDGAVKYYTVGDGVDLDVWRQSGAVWERVCILPGANAQNWTVAADADNPANVFIGRVAATSMYKSTDSGDTNWAIRTASWALNDIAVQDANTVYVAVQAFPWVLKGTGTFTTWTTLIVPFAAGGGNSFSLNLVADDQLIVGGTAGGVAYTADGGTTWGACANIAGGAFTITAASGVAAGDYIYAVTNAGGNISRWIIGTSFAWTAGNAIQGGSGSNGIALSNGVLYVLNPVVGVTVGHMHRILRPTVDFTGNATVGGTGTQSIPLAVAYNTGINTMFPIVAGTTTTFFAISGAVGLDPVDSYSDYITSASNAPSPTYPLEGDKISINSINGAVAGFVFKWTSPPVVVPPIPAPQTWNYNLQIYLDEAGLVPIAGAAAVAILGAASPAADLSVTSVAAGLAAVVVPGETYYWRVRVNMATPVQSYWSAMKTFQIEQLVAVVPVISSPANGTTIDSTTPAFSWSPIAGATSYSFELASDVDFTTIIYSATPAAAGAAVTTALEPGTYFWRVRALTPAAGEWSTVANFVIAEPPAVILPTQPPTLGSPVNGSSVDTVTPGFSWAPISGATMYRFQLAKDAEFALLVYTIDTASTGAGVPAANKLTRGAQYYWRVMALAPAEGEWSTVANFMVANLPAEQAPPVVVTTAPAPTIIVTQTNPPATTTTVVVPPAEEKVVNPTYIWAIIIIGAVLVIAVIVLIVRTRRSV